MRLKSRDKFVPGEFQMIHPEAGQKAPWKGSFSEIVRKELDFRSKNPTLVQKHGWSLEYRDVEDAVDLYNAQRMVAGGYFNFVDLDGGSPIEKKTTKGLFRSVAGAVGNVKVALAIYRDLLGPDGKVVAKDESERRATICTKCPQNDTAGGLKKYFLKEAAREIMLVAGMLKDLNVTTSLDDKLGVCEACECPMIAKVHTTNEVLKKHMPQEQIAKLDPNCWIPKAIA
jgi:hypothetical protein